MRTLKKKNETKNFFLRKLKKQNILLDKKEKFFVGQKISTINFQKKTRKNNK